MSEKTFKGIGASPGIVIGRAYLLDRRKVVIAEQQRIGDISVKDEVARFKQAVEQSKAQLDDVRKRVTKDLGKSHRYILDTHIMLLEDKMLVDGAIRRIKEEKIRSESALSETVALIVQKFDAMEDEYLRERKHDVQLVADRVLRNLVGRKQESLSDIRDEAIVIAHDLAPSDTLLMRKEKVLGFATDMGSRTSHTAIVARSMGIPAAVGLERITASVKTGDVVILDGNHGTVIVDPDEETFLDYLRRQQRYKYFEQELVKLRDLPAETLDGHRIELQGNIELVEEVAAVADHGGAGIGLYRTEFLFLNREHLPTEEQHYQAYRDVVERAAPHDVVIRTLDVGGDKVGLPGRYEAEPNPALGLRAIRFCLQNRDVFRAQLRGILRASAHGSIKVLFPMIAGLPELLEIKRLMQEVRDELRAEGVPQAERVQIGVMIEIPSAALTADLLAPEVDFFSIGTNDLIQYTLAIDRTNEHVAFMYEPLEPAVLRLLQRVSLAAHESRIGLAMCGEMAGDPLYAAILLGLGFQHLSMNVAAIPWVKRVIRSVRMQDAVELADLVMRQPTAVLARQAAVSFMQDRFPDLMAEI